jgi:hypothetical protein
MSQLNFRYKVSLSAHRPVPKPRRICGHRTGDWSLLFSPFKPHDRAVSKSVEQKPEIITEQMLSGLQFNEPLALWTFAPKTLQHRIRDAQTISGSVSTTNRLTIIFRFVGVVKKCAFFTKVRCK